MCVPIYIDFKDEVGCVVLFYAILSRFTQSFNRTNLQYSVIPKKPKKVIQDIIELINRSFRGQSGIVYCLSR